jgi:hypothetical protein
MNRRGLGAIPAALVAWVTPAAADPARHLRLGGDVVVPFADWNHVAGLGIGGDATVAVRIARDLDITARVAIVTHRSVAGAGLSTRVLEAPILGGAQLEVARIGRAAGFVYGEVGLVAVRTTVTITGVSDHNSRVRFGSALGGGVGFDRFDIRIGAWLADLGDLDHGVGAIGSIGGQVASW